MSFENFTSDSIASGKLLPAKIVSPELLNYLLFFHLLSFYLRDILIKDFSFVLIHLTRDVEVIFLRAHDGYFTVQKWLHVF